MAEEIGIVMTLYDKLSPTLKAMGNNTKAFEKTLQSLALACGAYERTQAGLNKSISALKTKLVESNVAVNNATNAWKKNQDELSRGVMDKAIAEQNGYRQQLKDTEAALNSSRKAVVNYSNELRRMDNSPLNSTRGGSLFSGLMQTGIIKVLENSVTQLSGTLLGSAVGQPAATAVSSILSGIASGATMGAMTGIPHGIALGAVIGGISGIANAATAVFSSQDEAFKTYISNQYDTRTQSMATSLESGSAIAGTRETDLVALTALIREEGVDPAEFQQELVEVGRTPPFSYDTATALAKSMLGMGLTAKETKENIDNLGSAASAKGMNSADVSTAAGILESFRAGGRVDALSFRALAKMGINVYDAVAEGFEMSPEEVAGQIENLDGAQVAEAIYKKMGDDFGEASGGMADTYSGQMGRLQSYLDDQDAALGRGYEEVRKDGVENQADYFSKGGGAAMEAMNTIIGAGKGQAENLKEQYQREAMAAVLQGTGGTLYDEGQQAKLMEMRDRYLSLKSEYEQAETSGDKEGMVSAAAHIETVKGEMESYAESVFNASTGMQEVKDAQLELIDAIRANTTALGFQTWGKDHQLAMAKSKGLVAGAIGRAPPVTEWTDEGGNTYSVGGTHTGQDGYYDEGGNWHGYAWGLPRVPYDNFPALLHAGERVLTASEARSADRGGEVQVTFTGPVTVREEADLDRLARKFAAEVRRAAMLAVPV